MNLLPRRITVLLALLFLTPPARTQQVTFVQQPTANGILEGVVSADGKVRSFKGIPYAAPPVGPLRWKPPEPAPSWTGVRKAAGYGPRCMQGRIFDDMIFDDAGPSEDCLYLNLWMPAKPERAKLPVMVWIYGGGFVAGATSEPRQDAGNLSKKGVLVVSMNYRLGIFGFFTHPDLAKESGRNAAGNYGLLDQVAALEWVKKNIAAFGGDPANVTIFGESAGSSSVSALIASPLARGLFQRAIGESGVCLGNHKPWKPLAEAEAADVSFAESAYGTSSLEALRAKPAQEILEATLKPQVPWFRPDVDGYFLPASCESIYSEGQQNRVALIAGWNRDEGSYREIFGDDPPTLANFVALAKAHLGSNVETFLKLYPASNDLEAKRAAQDFDRDMGIAHATWKWAEFQQHTGKSRIYLYQFDQALPLPADAKPGTEPTAPHAGEIEYVFRVLSSKNLPWRPEDSDSSEAMASYWANFARTGNPNGPGLPHWPAYTAKDGGQVMHLKANSAASGDPARARFEFIEHLPVAP